MNAAGRVGGDGGGTGVRKVSSEERKRFSRTWQCLAAAQHTSKVLGVAAISSCDELDRNRRARVDWYFEKVKLPAFLSMSCRCSLGSKPMLFAASLVKFKRFVGFIAMISI
jgi:hypothetical protein